jgi:hypothetical protein
MTTMIDADSLKGGQNDHDPQLSASPQNALHHPPQGMDTLKGLINMTALRAFVATIVLLAVAATIAALKLPETTHPTVFPTTATSSTPTLTPSDKVDYTPESPTDPGSTLHGTPGQVWISAGPGDDVCKAPGDCGYGDSGWSHLNNHWVKVLHGINPDEDPKTCIVQEGDTTTILCWDGTKYES